MAKSQSIEKWQALNFQVDHTDQWESEVEGSVEKKVKGRPEAAGAARQPLQESAGSASVSGGLSTIISAW